MRNVLWFVLAAICEIAGCYATWMWHRLGRPILWLLPGALSLIIFAAVLARIDTPFAGRAFAAYGGIYIVAALVWSAVVERVTPTATDFVGSAVCLAGAAIVFFGARWAT